MHVNRRQCLADFVVQLAGQMAALFLLDFKQPAGKGLEPGRVRLLCLFRLSSPAEHPYGSAVYGSRYQDQRGPTPSRSYLNFYRADV